MVEGGRREEVRAEERIWREGEKGRNIGGGIKSVREEQEMNKWEMKARKE